MKAPLTTKLALVAGALALVGGGAAIAADKLGPKQERDAIIASAAKEVGVEPAKLDAALKSAYESQIDAAVKAGQLTQDQADALKKRIEQNGVPLGVPSRGDGFGHRGGEHHGFGHRGGGAGLEAAAAYLGIDRAAMFDALRNGTTLAELAKQKGKTADGLKQAITAAVTKQLAEAVADGRLDKTRADAITKDLPTRIDDLINGIGPRGGFGHHGFGHGPEDGGPGDDDDTAPAPTGSGPSSSAPVSFA